MSITSVLIVGSGPAAVSAAWPLVRAGVHVTMVDADEGKVLPAPDIGLADFRASDKRWEYVIGKDLENINTLGDRSPKFVTPLGQSVLAKNHEPMAIQASNFTAPRSFAAGGLSNIWGALVSAYDEHDLQNFPFDHSELANHYHSVAARIGLSGVDDDDMSAFHGSGLPLQPPDWLMPIAKKLLRRYQRNPPGGGFQLGLARNAVITRDTAGKLGCNTCGMCMLGCARGSIYHSGSEVLALMQHSNFAYLRGHRVKRLVDVEGDIKTVEIEVTGETKILQAQTLVLAAGTLNTTGLVLQRQNSFGRKVRLLTNPAAALAFIVPSMLLERPVAQHFSLGQMSYRIDLGANRYSTGTLYGVDTLPLTIMADRLPLSRPVAMRLSAVLAPALLIANCWLDGSLSRNTLSLETGAKGPELYIKGEFDPEARPIFKQSMRRLSRSMLKLGAIPLPGSFAMVQPGSDAHLSGTLPMTREQRDLTTTPAGEIRPWRNVFAVDGAVLSSLPARHCTFTIMSNAERIGMLLANSLRAGLSAVVANV